MKNKQIKPTRSNFNIARQICNHIPQHEVSKIARETGAGDRARTFSPWSHVVSLTVAQLTHSIGLNDLCDSLQLHSGPLSRSEERRVGKEGRLRFSKCAEKPTA